MNDDGITWTKPRQYKIVPGSEKLMEICGFFGPYRFLSNFYMVAVEYEGLWYTSSEAAFQSAKVLDKTARLPFTTLGPSDAKKLGRQVTKREDWEQVRDQVMWDVLSDKFKHAVLRRQLLDTGEAYLEETNSWGDVYWGVSRGEGENRLGDLLMELRAKLRDEDNFLKKMSPSRGRIGS